MQLSKRTEYGLRAVVHLATGWPRLMQIRDLAHREKLPGKFLEAILLALRNAGLLESKAGMGGGYRLSRSPSEIPVGDVIRTLERKFGTDVPRRRPQETTLGQHALAHVSAKLGDAVANALNSLTLEQLREHASRAATDDPEMYYI